MTAADSWRWHPGIKGTETAQKRAENPLRQGTERLDTFPIF
jgi:hypothetical protein